MVLTFKDGISEFHKLACSPAYRAGFNIQLFIWSEKGLFPEECAGKEEQGVFLGEV